jgi:7-carboxy-7-deazaguanine synthase
MRITEIFRSIQGESTYAGLPCTFVRLTGCNLRCVWCDTTYAFAGGEVMSIEEIIEKISAFPLDLVEITGGEPLTQKETPQLCQAILDLGAKVLIETGGSRDIGVLPQQVIRIMDIKCPGSGELHSNCWENISKLRFIDEVKFVIADQQDFNWAVDVVQRHDLLNKCTVLFSPVHGQVDLDSFAQWTLETQLPIRMQLQMHKSIWGPEKRGV